jgi:hypothetical protein
MNILSDDSCRTITTDDVRVWFGKSPKSKLKEAQYCELAAFLTRCRWPGDPPDPPDSPWLVRIIEDDQEQWWDFKGVSQAARNLLESMPQIVSCWETRLRSEGKDQIRKLQEALSDAIEYIEWPFGRYKRQTGQKTPKPWHIYAQLIARAIIGVMIEAGHEKPAVSRNSVVVRVAQKALMRMKIPNAGMVTRTAIAAYLTRWDGRYGLSSLKLADHSRRHDS